MTIAVQIRYSRREHRHAIFWKFEVCVEGVATEDEIRKVCEADGRVIESAFTPLLKMVVSKMHETPIPGYSKMKSRVESHMGYLANAPETFVADIGRALGEIELQGEMPIPMAQMRVLIRQMNQLFDEGLPEGMEFRCIGPELYGPPL